MAQTEGKKNVLLQILRETPPAHFLNERAQHLVIWTGIRVDAADRSGQADPGKRFDVVLQGSVRSGGARGICRQAAVLVKQLTHCDPARRVRIRHTKIGQVALHGRIQFDLPAIHQLHHRRGGEKLADRSDDERRLRSNFSGARGTAAETVGDLLSFHDDHRDARDQMRLRLFLDDPVERFPHRLGDFPARGTSQAQHHRGH